MKKQTVDTVYDTHEKLLLAIDEQNIDLVASLIKTVPAYLNESEALTRAVVTGNIDIVKLLLPHTNPKDNEQLAFITAIYWEHIDIVKLLLPQINPTHSYSVALTTAAIHSNIDLFDLILSVTDAKNNNHDAIIASIETQDTIKTMRLIPFSNYNTVVKRLMDFNANSDIEYFEEIYSNYQKSILNDYLQDEYNNTISRKRKI